MAVVREIEDSKFLAFVGSDGESVSGDPGETPEHAIRDLLVMLACGGLPMDVGFQFR